MNTDKARLRAMQALGQLLPADDSGKMEERAIKGYIEMLETVQRDLQVLMHGGTEVTISYKIVLDVQMVQVRCEWGGLEETYERKTLPEAMQYASDSFPVSVRRYKETLPRGKFA